MKKSKKFEKRRKPKGNRKHSYREPNTNSYLIITEGTETERNYFQGIERKISSKMGTNIVIKVIGRGRSTKKLIKCADEEVKKAHKNYQHIWLVFDKDEFKDFDEAIKLAKKKDYEVAWSNQSFEYFLYLHFNYSDSALHRNVWSKKLNELFKSHKISGGKYEKNIEDIFELLDKDIERESDIGVKKAIKNAEKRYNEFNSKSQKPSEFDPGTTVHKLVKELLSYIDE